MLIHAALQHSEIDGGRGLIHKSTAVHSSKFFRPNASSWLRRPANPHTIRKPWAFPSYGPIEMHLSPVYRFQKPLFMRAKQFFTRSSQPTMLHARPSDNGGSSMPGTGNPLTARG